ncbi:VOC family protein [Mangrovimonas sp. DI 80]|uniref:VOC family protein n=1 Tax=Mangrovimonas sp. DI 80 TaxID=1779330 RepID=UPI000975FA26|nr:VOC family protein [Mangrovimonas sp. DI 80]OMP31573.1 glyoxalase/bleomycin resistance/extradiol dioxygenase family protein [Mangrovimonas sp. DI 80]
MENKQSPMLGLRTVVYMVEDLEKAKAWYAKAFNAQPYYDTPYYVGFNIGGYELGLHPKEKVQGTDNGTVQTYWGVEDIQKVYDILVEMGATKHEAPNNVGGDIVVASVYDPWKNIIGIIYNPEFKLPK